MKRKAASALLLLILPLLYVGSYLALVVPWGEVATYRWGGRVSAQIYWPLEQTDRRLRPDRWAPRPGWEWFFREATPTPPPHFHC